MKSIIYRYSRRFFLTSEITRRIESRIFILYPSTRYSVINRTAEYLIKIYILAGIVTAGLFLYADFSLYYATISALVVYAVVNSRVYGELDKLEIRLLMQFEKFITDVKFRFQFDGMLEEALQDMKCRCREKKYWNVYRIITEKKMRIIRKLHRTSSFCRFIPYA